MYKGFSKKTENKEVNKMVRAKQTSHAYHEKVSKARSKSNTQKKKSLKDKVKQQVDWAWRDIKSDFMPTEKRKKVQEQIAKEKRAEYQKNGGFANDKTGQFLVGLGKGVVDNSVAGAAYSIAKGKKLSESKTMTKGNKTIKAPNKKTAKYRKAGNIAGEMFGYATELRSRTQGRGQYSMEPSHFAEVPKSIQEKIIAGRK